MRVYAESNFVLEIILEQEQHQACEELVSLAASKSIELVLPAFALLEPYQTIVRRELQGNDLRAELREHAKLLIRTASIAADISRLSDASDLLMRAEQEAKRRFLDVYAMLLDTAHLIAIDGSALREAAKLTTQFGLKLPDALVLASVLADAAARPSPSVFLNRDTKGFDDPDVKACLKQEGCHFIGGFEAGLARVRNTLTNASVDGV